MHETYEGYVRRRGRRWYYVRRVPKDIKGRWSEWPGGLIQHSLKTADTSLAYQRARDFHAHVEDTFAKVRMGDGFEAGSFKRAKAMAQAKGFDYLPATQLAGRELAELLSRVTVAEQSTDAATIDGLLGLAKAPTLSITDAVDEYERLTASERAMQGDTARKRWRQAFDREARNLVEALGDNKSIYEVTRADAVRFRDWWLAKVAKEGKRGETARTGVGKMTTMFRTLLTDHDPAAVNPFDGLKVRGGGDGERLAMTVDEARKLLHPEALTLNAEARDVLAVLIETGLRPAELLAVRPQDIRLKANVPHIAVEPYDGNPLKNRSARRTVPLVGLALEIMRRWPDGFKRYRGKAGSLSATMSKALKSSGLVRPGVTLYSARHGFMDRMVAAELPARVRDEIFGHAIQETARYGQGSSLEQKARHMQRIAIMSESIQ